mgnify:CR=1 FL=1
MAARVSLSESEVELACLSGSLVAFESALAMVGFVVVDVGMSSMYAHICSSGCLTSQTSTFMLPSGAGMDTKRSASTSWYERNEFRNVHGQIHRVIDKTISKPTLLTPVCFAEILLSLIPLGKLL